MLVAIFLWWAIGCTLWFADILLMRIAGGRNKDFYSSDFFVIIMAGVTGFSWALVYHTKILQ